MTLFLVLHWLNTVPEAHFLEGVLAGWEAFKISFICIFAPKFFKIYSPQECVLQQHSCMGIRGKLRQKDAVEASHLKSSGRYLVQGKKNTGACTVLKLLQAVQGFLHKQGTTDPCPEAVASSFY